MKAKPVARMLSKVRSVHNPAKYVKLRHVASDDGGIVSPRKVASKEVVELCNKSVLPVSAIYCFELPRYDDLIQLSLDQRELLKHERTTIVKYGMSKDLTRRTREHQKTYGPECRLLFYANVHQSHLREAEDAVRSLFKCAGWHARGINGHRELACVPVNRLRKTVIPMYKTIGVKYGNR